MEEVELEGAAGLDPVADGTEVSLPVVEDGTLRPVPVSEATTVMLENVVDACPPP